MTGSPRWSSRRGARSSRTARTTASTPTIRAARNRSRGAGASDHGSVSGHGHPAELAPIFPTADMEAMQAHYEALGFSVHVHGGGYGTAARDGIRIHFKLVPELGPATERGAAYLGGRRRRRAARRMAGGGGGGDLGPLRPRIRRVGGGPHRRRREPAALRLPGHAAP